MVVSEAAAVMACDIRNATFERDNSDSYQQNSQCRTKTNVSPSCVPDFVRVVQKVKELFSDQRPS